jgi:hypothetical protein
LSVCTLETIKEQEIMTCYFDQKPVKCARIRRLAVAAVAVGSIFGSVNFARAQSIPSPVTPALITPPAGNSAFLVGNARGTQGYICLPTAPGAPTASWTVDAARPEATLFRTFFGLQAQIITHFLSPDTEPNDAAPSPLPFASATWQSSLDTSKVWAAVLHGNVLPASPNEPSCPNGGSIPCLLLQSIGSQNGPTGGTILSKTTFIQRLNTNGGSAPADGCFTSADVGKQVLVPYTADYYFFHKGN